MKIQLAYKYTGEDIKKLTKELKEIVKILEESNFEVYCPVLDLEKPENKKDLFLGTLDKISNIDILLALITSENKSEGMLMEIGVAFSKKKKVICAIKNNIKNTHMRDLAHQVIEFEDMEDLLNKLKEVNINENRKTRSS